MIEFDYEKIMQPKIVIHLRNKEQVNMISEWADRVGLRWRDKTKYINIENFNEYGERTAYDFYTGEYCNISFYAENNYKILKYEEVLKVNKTKQLKELLRGMTLEEASEAGISSETYEAVTKKDEVEELVWKPNNGDRYWCIDSFGGIDFSYWGSDHHHNYRLSQGNVYKTKELAEKALEFSKKDEQVLKRQIENWLVCNDDGWVADWKDDTQKKYNVYFGCLLREWDYDFTFINKGRDIVMSKSNAKKLAKLLKTIKS